MAYGRDKEARPNGIKEETLGPIDLTCRICLEKRAPKYFTNYRAHHRYCDDCVYFKFNTEKFPTIPRKCLRCSRKFPSKSVENRLCFRCREVVKKYDHIEEY